MVNRNIQQKIVKMKRRGKSRVYGKQFINTGQGPKIGSVTELYRHKLTDDAVDQWLNTKFPGKVYTDAQLIEHNKHDAEKANLLGQEANPIPLGEVKSLIIKHQLLMKKTILENHFKVTNKYFHKVDIFFSADKTCWSILEMKSLGSEQFVRRSCIYSSKLLAIQALQLQVVEWVETVPLRRLPTVLP